MSKIPILISLMLLISTVSAQPSTSPPSITPDSPLYTLKLWFEDIQETLTFNSVAKLNLQQEHLQNRLKELQYESAKNYNKNSEILLQKIQIKQLEIEDTINTWYPGSVSIQKSEDVLTNLINSTDMPEQSRKGLENAYNNVMMPKGIIVSGNMVQGTYSANPSYLSLLPFTNVAVLDPTDSKWYTISINDNKIIILDYLTKDTPQYYLYPTTSQINSLNEIAKHINKNGITIRDRITLLKLWYNIKKTEVN